MARQTCDTARPAGEPPYHAVMTEPASLATHEWQAARTDATGPQPVALLVHGITGWYRTWWRVGPALAEHGWRVVAIDQRGHGRSPRIDGTVDVCDLAADLGAAIDRLGAPIDLLVAHSLGAAVALELVHARPGIARRLVLEDPPSVTRADDLEFQARLERDVLAARDDPASEIRRELAENPLWLEEDARQNVEGRAMVDLEGTLASLRANTRTRVLELTPDLALPTLFMLADEERSVVGEARSELLASLPSVARALTFDSGHTIHRDRPDEYVAAVLAWVAATPIER
jgi:pimeloyl-ACP methyl ester carboxylesterase